VNHFAHYSRSWVNRRSKKAYPRHDVIACNYYYRNSWYRYLRRAPSIAQQMGVPEIQLDNNNIEVRVESDYR
jgi:hypothetical protein